MGSHPILDTHLDSTALQESNDQNLFRPSKRKKKVVMEEAAGFKSRLYKTGTRAIKMHGSIPLIHLIRKMLFEH